MRRNLAATWALLREGPKWTFAIQLVMVVLFLPAALISGHGLSLLREMKEAEWKGVELSRLPVKEHVLEASSSKDPSSHQIPGPTLYDAGVSEPTRQLLAARGVKWTDAPGKAPWSIVEKPPSEKFPWGHLVLLDEGGGEVLFGAGSMEAEELLRSGLMGVLPMTDTRGAKPAERPVEPAHVVFRVQQDAPWGKGLEGWLLLYPAGMGGLMLIVGIWWDGMRRLRELEPMALMKTAPWAWGLATAIRSGALVPLAFWMMLAASSMGWEATPSPAMVLASGLLVTGALLFSFGLGFLQANLFHTHSGRMLARAMFFPVLFGVGWMTRLTLVHEPPPTAAGWLDFPPAPSAAMAAAWGLMGIFAGCGMLALAERRIGRRRIGMRRF